MTTTTCRTTAPASGLRIHPGDTLSYLGRFADCEGNARDLTGITVTAWLAPDPALRTGPNVPDTRPARTDCTVTVTDPLTGAVKISLPAAGTQSLNGLFRLLVRLEIDGQFVTSNGTAVRIAA